MENPAAIFAKNLKRLRESKRLTQETLAERCGLAVGTIRNFEQKKRFPRKSQLEALTRGLGIHVQFLFDEEDRPLPTIEASWLTVVEVLTSPSPSPKQALERAAAEGRDAFSAGIESGIRQTIKHTVASAAYTGYVKDAPQTIDLSRVPRDILESLATLAPSDSVAFEQVRAVLRGHAIVQAETPRARGKRA